MSDLLTSTAGDMNDLSPAFVKEAMGEASGFGVRAIVRNGWELLAIITGERSNEHIAIEKLQERGALGDRPVRVLSEAKLNYNIPMAIMPCSHVSGLTARLLYGDAASSASLIYGRPELCVQEGVVHLRQFAIGPVELPTQDEEKVCRRSQADMDTPRIAIYGRRHASG